MGGGGGGAPREVLLTINLLIFVLSSLGVSLEFQCQFNLLFPQIEPTPTHI